jgi:hypothetical protein
MNLPSLTALLPATTDLHGYKRAKYLYHYLVFCNYFLNTFSKPSHPLQGLFFCFPNMWGRWTSNLPKEELAKFGYSLESQVDFVLETHYSETYLDWTPLCSVQSVQSKKVFILRMTWTSLCSVQSVQSKKVFILRVTWTPLCSIQSVQSKKVFILRMTWTPLCSVQSVQSKKVFILRVTVKIGVYWVLWKNRLIVIVLDVCIQWFTRCLCICDNSGVTSSSCSAVVKSRKKLKCF